MRKLGRPKIPARVLIIGGAGWRNVGDDLIASALKEWVSTDSRATRVIGGPHPSILDADGKAPVALEGNLASRLRMIMEILRSDYVLIGGGGLLDDRVPFFYRPFTRAALVCRLTRTPYAWAGIGVGPIQAETSQEAYRKAAQHADRVYVRDLTSKERLIACGVQRWIDIVPDPVLWSGRKQETREEETEFDLAINLRNWHTAVTPRRGYAGPTDEEVVRIVANAVNADYGEGGRIALVSMSGQEGDDDSEVLNKLRLQLKANTTTFFDCAPSEVQRVIGASACVLSMRLHACLLGAERGRKVIGLAYDPKVKQQGNLVGFTSVSLDGAFLASGKDQIIAELTESVASSPSRFPFPALPWHM